MSLSTSELLQIWKVFFNVMFNQSPYRSSKSRLTKQEEAYLMINDQIVAHISALSTPLNAEDIWLGLKMKDMAMSITSFHTRLKRLVEAGRIEKRPVAYNKYEYLIGNTNGSHLPAK